MPDSTNQLLSCLIGVLIGLVIIGTIISFSNLSNQIDENEIDLKEIIVSVRELERDISELSYDVKVMFIELNGNLDLVENDIEHLHKSVHETKSLIKDGEN